MNRIKTIREQVEDAIEDVVNDLGSVRAAEVIEALGVSDSLSPGWRSEATTRRAVASALSSLARQRRITRVSRGVYAATEITE